MSGGKKYKIKFSYADRTPYPFGVLSYTGLMTLTTTAWTDATITPTHWPLFPDQDDPNNLWDYASDTWDNSADTWDALFSFDDDHPASTTWADLTAPATTAWATDL